ncbi:MAG: helix-turn-helix domain-containing protein [Gemmataceae bacterium]
MQNGLEIDGEQLNRIETKLERIFEVVVEARNMRAFYTIEEFAGRVGTATYTVREWCRQRRIHAQKQNSGRGKHQAWVISHEELERYRREGLLYSKTP